MNEDEELIAAVEALLSDPRTDPGLGVENVGQAVRAVGLLDEGLRSGPGVFRLMAEGGQRGAETLSSDRLQVLSEMVQNADDMGAGQVRFIWRPEELLIAHDGKGVRLADVLLLGLPWLSGKTSDAEATGRFGIGLATLRALATIWEVHCYPFHVRFADLSIRAVEPLMVPEQLAGPEWTVFRIPLAADVLSASELFEWFETWNDSSLLFLRHVRRVEALSDCPDEQGADDETPSVTLRLSWTEIDRRRLRIDGEEADVRVREARTTSGGLWRVYDAHVAPHGTSTRRHKAVGASMPVAVALPVHGPEMGSVHAGLPVVELRAAARVHAQFDPVVSREGFAASRWNEDLVPLVADLWAAAALDVLSDVEPSAWHLVPLPSSDPSSTPRLQDSIRAALVDRSRTWLASQLSLPCPDGNTKPLSALAVEEPQLSGVLGDEDIARLAGLPTTFPQRARDVAHQWREVLTDWRDEGTAELADEVRVSDALLSLDDTEYGVEQTIRLTAVAIEEDLDYLVRNQPCVITADGRRLRPTAVGVAFAEHQDAEPRGTSPLDALGIVVNLHASYSQDSQWSRSVLGWLRKQDCLVRRDDTAAVLRRIERMGRAGRRIGGDTVCGVEQLVAIQRGLGEVSKKVRERLGPGIGRAVLLDGYMHDPEGNEKPCMVQPAHAYLPQALESTDGDRFAAAAGKTPGIRWVHRSYARTLLSQAQCGLSRTAFLRLLGVADAPRLKELQPSWETKEYETDSRIGLSRDCQLSPAARRRELRRLGAHYTLDDRSSPDLDAVVQHIIAEQNPQDRRRRTAALLQTLGKPGMITFSEHADVQAAEAYYRWNVRGQTAALWVWRLRETAWLEDSSGKLRTPGQVHLRTRDAQALYGQDDPGYLHPAIHQPTSNRIDVLAALGVNGDPDVPQLIHRLRELRERSTAPGPVDDHLKAEVYLVYQALAGRLRSEAAGTSRSELRKKVRDAFSGTDFVLTDQGWQRAGDCFRGPTILRGFRPFAIPDPELNPLWDALWIEEPRPEDLADVLKEIAQSGTQLQADHQRVTLEALRSLADTVTSADGPVSPGLRSKLRWLPLRTTLGWTKARPVYAVDHPAIARTLGEHLHVWQPGGDLQQFIGLLGLLKVHKLEASEACVVAPDRARPDRQLTEDFRWAVTSLQDTLVRDEPAAAEAFTDWAWLMELEVRVLPELRIRLNPGEDHEVIEVPVDAHVDPEAKALFVSSPEALRTTRGGGLAVASLFSTERAHVGHRWRDLWETDWPQDAPVAPLVPSGQQDHEDRERLASQLRERELSRPSGPAVPSQPRGPVNPPAGVSSIPAPPPAPMLSGVGAPPTLPSAEPRKLVSLAELQARTPQSTCTNASSQTRSASSSGKRRAGSLPQPRQGGAAPTERSGPLGYQDRDKEKVVLELLARILHEQGRTLEDQRGLLRLGADAVDSAEHFYEIKAHGGAEPTDVSLTSAELTRALAEGSNYSLVIASNLEEGRGTPTLRIITDPLRFFEVESTAEVRLKGVRDADADATVWQWPDAEA